MEILNETIEHLDKITIVFSFITMLAVFYNHYKNKQQLQKIGIYFLLKSNGKKIPVDTNLTRRDCKRSEIQGILRTKLKKEVNFYDVRYLATDEYFKQIFTIQNAKLDELVIELQDDELEQFSIKH